MAVVIANPAGNCLAGIAGAVPRTVVGHYCLAVAASPSGFLRTLRGLNLGFWRGSFDRGPNCLIPRATAYPAQRRAVPRRLLSILSSFSRSFYSDDHRSDCQLASRTRHLGVFFQFGMEVCCFGDRHHHRVQYSPHSTGACLACAILLIAIGSTRSVSEPFLVDFRPHISHFAVFIVEIVVQAMLLVLLEDDGLAQLEQVLIVHAAWVIDQVLGDELQHCCLFQVVQVLIEVMIESLLVRVASLL